MHNLKVKKQFHANAPEKLQLQLLLLPPPPPPPNPINKIMVRGLS